MRTFCLLILLCFVAAGPVAAASVSLVPDPVAPVRVIPGNTGPLNQSLPAFVPLTLISYPAGASVSLDGTDTGNVTPVNLTLGRTRVYSVKLSLGGYRDYIFDTNLSDGVPITIVAQLQPRPGPAAGLTLRPVPVSPEARVSPGAPDGFLPGISPTPEATRVPALRKQEGVIDSFVGFFSGILTRPDCPPSLRACGSSCVDLATNPTNCGLCGYVCPDTAVCSGGECFTRGQ
jgi:hypothetical protein